MVQMIAAHHFFCYRNVQLNGSRSVMVMYINSALVLARLWLESDVNATMTFQQSTSMQEFAADIYMYTFLWLRLPITKVFTRCCFISVCTAVAKLVWTTAIAPLTNGRVLVVYVKLHLANIGFPKTGVRANPLKLPLPVPLYSTLCLRPLQLAC